MITKLKPKSEFSRNVLTLMTGTTIAQAIPIAISPILTRIYTPEDFGVFSIYTSITLILGVIICGRYELAVMLPKYKKYSELVFLLSIILSSFLSCIFFVLILSFSKEICDLLNLEYENTFWLYFIPISTFLTGLYQSIYYLNNKNKQYSVIAKSKIIQNFSLSFFSVILGKIGFNFLGLIFGNLLGQLISSIYLIYDKNLNKLKINKVKIIALAKKYSSLPKYDILASLSGIASHQILPILFSIYYSPLIAGYVYLMQRVISSPVNLVSSAVLDVFKEKASEDYVKLNNAKVIYKNTFKKLFIVAFFPSIILYFYSVDIFTIIFGEEWSIAGEYTKYMIPMLFFRFISNPLSFMFYITNKENLNLYMQLTLLVAIISTFFIVNTEIEAVKYISIIFTFFYIVQIFLSAKFAKVF